MSIKDFKISDDVKLDFALKAWENVGEIAERATESDTGMLKKIKVDSEHRPRGAR